MFLNAKKSTRVYFLDTVHLGLLARGATGLQRARRRVHPDIHTADEEKKNEGQTDFSYYGLYLLDYLRTNKFEQADDTAFIRERADRAAETYERARLEGYPADGAQELAMDTLLRGLHYSRYAILREVVENEFADEVPEEKREAFVLKLLPLVGNVFSVYDLSDDNFALSSDYDLLYTELTGGLLLTYTNPARIEEFGSDLPA